MGHKCYKVGNVMNCKQEEEQHDENVSCGQFSITLHLPNIPRKVCRREKERGYSRLEGKFS